jgi:amino acid transporter
VSDAPTHLRRSLSLGDLLVYGLVFIGPIAPVAVFGIVFDMSGGMVPLAYLIGLAAMLFLDVALA